jgi:TrkA domain protein
VSKIREVRLPGVGVRYEFKTEDGDVVGVVTHRSGRRDIYIASPDDKDRFELLLNLDEEDARTLAELLGASRVTQELAALQQHIEGLVIDWLRVPPDSPYAIRTVGDARIRTRTGVSVVAVVRGEEAIAAPGPDTTIQAGDYLVVVGTSPGIRQLVDLLHSG